MDEYDPNSDIKLASDLILEALLIPRFILYEYIKFMNTMRTRAVEVKSRML